MSSWTVQDWLLLIAFVGGIIGVVLKSQHSLITGLLRDKWEDSDKRHDSAESRLGAHDDLFHRHDIRINNVEMTCDMRHKDK
jgi:hypothetical protein